MFLLKPKVIFLLAIISGVLAFYGFSRYLKQQEENLRKPRITSLPVVVAASDLPLGTALALEHLQAKEWPADIVAKGSFRDISALKGRVLKTDVAAGEAILESKLAPKGSGEGVSSLIPPGMRAISVAVNVVSGVSGFILPNAWVDVLVTVAPSSDKNKTFTSTILENVQVLAVDQTYKKDDNSPVTVQSVTLLVTPEEAEKLALGANEGKLQLTLRNTADSELNGTPGALLTNLSSRPTSKPKPRRVRRKVTPPPPAPKVEEKPLPRVVEVIRSNVKTELTFEDENSNSEEKEEKKEKRPPSKQ